MKQYLLFAGRGDADLRGVHGLAGEFDSFAEAFISLVDQQTPAQWWHILDTKSGEVVERRHLKVHNGMIGFERSEWVAGQTAKKPLAAPAPLASPFLPKAAGEEVKAVPVPAPASVEAISVALPIAEPKAADLSALEADLRSVVVGAVKNGHANGAANGKANGHAN